MRFLKRQTNIRRSGFSALLHWLLVGALPILMYILVRIDFTWIAVLLLVLSKWRMFAVKPRHWLANFRVNAVDIFVGLSVLIFMNISSANDLQVFWAIVYGLWLLFIKPRSTQIWVGLQAMIAQAIGLAALYIYWSEAPTLFLVVGSWGLAYLCARHFLSVFDDGMSKATAYAWAFFAAAIAWLSGHWLIFYGPVAQPALLLSVLGYGLAAMYYLQHTDKLSANVRLQFIGVMSAIVLFLIVFSDWSDKTI